MFPGWGGGPFCFCFPYHQKGRAPQSEAPKNGIPIAGRLFTLSPGSGCAFCRPPQRKSKSIPKRRGLKSFNALLPFWKRRTNPPPKFTVSQGWLEQCCGNDLLLFVLLSFGWVQTHFAQPWSNSCSFLMTDSGLPQSASPRAYLRDLLSQSERGTLPTQAGHRRMFSLKTTSSSIQKATCGSVCLLQRGASGWKGKSGGGFWTFDGGSLKLPPTIRVVFGLLGFPPPKMFLDL